MKSILKICVVLTLVCTVMAVILAGINNLTEPLIQKNEDTLRNQTLTEFFPDLSDSVKIADKIDHDKQLNELYEIKDTTGSTIGLCADVTATGYAGDVNMMIGLSADGHVIGIRVISHSETKGLSEKSKADTLIAEFTKDGGAIGKQKFTDRGGAIDKIAGATYSSKAVLNGVNTAMAAYDAFTAEGGDGQ